MNFLAHCALAADAADQWECSPQQKKGLLAGAVIGDFVKGSIPEDWPIPLQAGARLHRRVDALSNTLPGIRTSCDRYPAHLRRFAPIFVDMLADHSLANQWPDYYNEDIDNFARECYQAIATFEDYLSQPGKRFFAYMQESNLLANYHQWHHIRRGLASVLRRLQREEMLAEVERASAEVAPLTQGDFAGFYPELRAAWQEWDAFAAINAEPRS